MPLIATVQALDVEAGFRRAWPGFHLLNGILNFALGRQTYTIFSTAYWQPVGDVLLPPMHGVFDASGAFKLPFLHQIGAIKYRRPELGTAEWGVADRFLKILSHAPPPDSILDVIADTLGRYDDALQAHDWGDGFFILWQLLEAITHPPKEKAVNIDNVCVRVSRLLGNSSFVLDLLRQISDARNRFVHAGQPPDDPLKEFGFLKAVAGACIDSLYSMRESLHTRSDLMVFFRYA